MTTKTHSMFSRAASRIRSWFGGESRDISYEEGKYLIPWGSESKAGVRITPYTSLRYSPVWQAINLISADVAKLPLNVYVRTPSVSPSARQVDRNHPAQKLIRRRPTDIMSAFEMWRRVMVHALLWNNAYVYIRRSNGVPVELLPLLPDRTTIYDHDDGMGRVFVTEVNGEIWGLTESQVLHIEGINFCGDGKLTTWQLARDSWALGLAGENLASQFFARGGRTGGILEVPYALKDRRDKIEEGFRKTYEDADAAFRTYVAREGVKFQAAQHNAKDTQMLESRQESVRDVARWFNLPPHKLGDDTRVSYNSLEQENRAYINSTLSAWLHTIQAECWLKLLTTEEQDSDSHFVEYNVDALLATDAKTRTEIAVMEIGARTMSPNEYRDMLNRPPYEGGDDFANPAITPGVGGDEDIQDEPPPSEDDEDQMRAAAERGLAHAVDNAAKVLAAQIGREVGRKKPIKFCDWFDDARSKHVQMVAAEIEPFAEAVAVACGVPHLGFVLRISEAVADSVRSNVAKCLEMSEVEGMIDDVRYAADRAAETQAETLRSVICDTTDSAGSQSHARLEQMVHP